MSATSNIPLKVPFKEKDEAKSLGARWNPEAKHWYVPEGVDSALFAKWLNDALPQSEAKSINPTNARHQATTKPKSKTALPEDVDMDDINALLRDAYEVDDNSI